jgi:hypothetical protein
MSAAFALVERAVQRLFFSLFFKAPTVAQKYSTAQMKTCCLGDTHSATPFEHYGCILTQRPCKTRRTTNRTAAYPFSRVGWEKIQPTFCSPSMPASPSTSC